MKQKDSVRAFKNELRNYNYYLSRVVSLEQSIEWCYERLGGLRGIDPSKEPLHVVPNKEYEWKLRDDIERFEAQKKLIEAKISYIDEILKLIENPLKWAIVSIYVENKRTDSISSQLFLSPHGLHSRINRAIGKSLEDGTQ